MAKLIAINAGAGETRIALLRDGKLARFWFERSIGVIGDAGEPERRTGLSHVGDIILGRVHRVMAATDAAFVDVGLSRAGFLSARDAVALAPATAANDRDPAIGTLVREGDAILVQVVKDPIADKGARLTANVSLPGRFLVLKSNLREGAPRFAFSRRLAEGENRERLTAALDTLAQEGSALVEAAGYIVRTAAEAAAANDLRDDALGLKDAWNAIADARKHARAPATLHRDLSLIERILRDEPDTARVLIDDSAVLREVTAHVERVFGGHGPALEHYQGAEPLFEVLNLEDDIASLMAPRVKLPAGGWITIEGTEAMTVIDVNSGSYAMSGGTEDTGLAVNLEAASEIGRQLGLRGIGGLIAVDFIDMFRDGYADQLMARLAEAFAADRAPVRILAPSEFGIVEMTRKRVGESLNQLLTEPCGGCFGHGGRQKTLATLAMDALRRAEKAARAAPGKPVTVHGAPEFIAWMQAHDTQIRAELGRRGVAQIAFAADASLSRDGFSVTTGG